MLLLAFLLAIVSIYFFRFRAKKDPLAPTSFPYLTPESLKSFRPRAWRPFRWPYHQTMTIFKLNTNYWLDMDKHYLKYIESREAVFKKYGDDFLKSLPESNHAVHELLDMVTDHITTRYPNLFKKTKTRIDNLITNESFDLSRPLKQDPLYIIGRLVMEDVYVVQQRPDGQHYLVAAAVPHPGGFFTIKEKLGKPLNEIHEPVPHFEQKLKPSMERWFSKLKAESPVERASYFISWDFEYMVNAIYALEPEEPIPKVDPKEFVVRICRQTLRRLPKSKAIIFTNYPLFYRIEEMKDEPMIPSLLKKMVEEGPDKIIEYKSMQKLRDTLLPYLDTLINRQYELGIIKPEDPVKTQPTYPFAYWYDKEMKDYELKQGSLVHRN